MNASPDIEARLRAHLAAEREAIRPPADLEVRVRRRLQESVATRTRTGVVASSMADGRHPTPPWRRLGKVCLLLVDCC